jgi:kynureninase
MTSTLTDPLLEYRAEFPILESSAYFAAHTLGPVCRESLEALRLFGEQWATRGVRAWGDSWMALPDVVGEAIGHLMNAPKNSVNTPPHATAAMASLLSSLDFSGSRNGIVTTDVEFPSVLQQTTAWGQYGANVTVVKSVDGLTPPLESLLEAIDETTKLVAICHVYFRNAYILDVEAVVKRAREVGAWVWYCAA